MSKLFSLLILLSALGAAVAIKGQSRRLYRRSQGARGALRGASAALGPVEQTETWQDHGKSVKSKLTDENLMELASHITEDVYSKELHSLVDNRESRFVAHTGNMDAASYIEKQFKEMGLTVTDQKIDDSRLIAQGAPAVSDPSKSKLRNVIGFLKGSETPNEVVLLGAHFDSVNWDDTTKEAPGVDDNGSGSALVLAVARRLMSAGFKPRRSVMFVAFNGEEEGCVGSEHFASMLKKEGTSGKFGDLKAAFIADEVAWPGSGKERRKAIFETKGQNDGTNAMVDTLARLASLKNKTSDLGGDGLGDGTDNFLVNYHGFGSDHISFLSNDFPAVLLIERDDDYHADTWGHSARDTFEHVDLDYGASMTRLALRAIAAFASPEDAAAAAPATATATAASPL